MNIQTIIDNAKTKYPLNTFSGEALKELEVVLKDSLTSMLSEIEKELPEKTPQEVIDRQTYHVALRSQGENTYRQEVINIINSHK